MTISAFGGSAAATIDASSVASSPGAVAGGYHGFVSVPRVTVGRPHWASSALTEVALAVVSNSPMTMRCAAGVPVGVSGKPTDEFHCCGPMPNRVAPASGVHAAEEYSGARKEGSARAGLAAPTNALAAAMQMSTTAMIVRGRGTREA